MSGAPGRVGALTRALAARAVETVIAAGRTLDEALSMPELDELAAPDRAQVKALAFGAVRWHHRHRQLLGMLLDRPLPTGEKRLEALLSVGLFQLLDERQPDYAVVSATVEATRLIGRPRASGLVNASLRRLQRERTALLARALETPEGRYSHPGWLIERLRRDWPRHWAQVLEAAQAEPPLWLRVNAMRCTADEYCARLAESGVAVRREASLPQAVRLARSMPVEAIPGFPAGEVTVQDAAAQLATQLLDARPGMRVLDACAAPGGKTTHLLERADGRLDLVALDIDPARLARLRENLTRLGLQAEIVTGDGLRPRSWWDGRSFDRILVDAPCSGTGVIRRHPDIKLLRREADVATLAGRQLSLLEALWPLLRPGGRLLYVTCSILTEENSAVAERFLAAHADAALAAPAVDPPSWAMPLGYTGLQVLPGMADTDGFYYVLMSRH